jgi:hypothetical protein
VILVRCRDCSHFIPDKIGFGQGIGKCRQYEEYKAKGPGAQALRDALRKLGNNPDYDGDLFWNGGLIDRNCEKFEANAE